MTHLRKMMLEELQRRNYSENTIRCYIRTVEDFARRFNCSPDRLGPRHIREYQAELFQKRKLSSGSVAVRLAALRFFYCKTLKKGWNIAETPYPKREHRLPEILSREEVARLIQGRRHPLPSHPADDALRHRCPERRVDTPKVQRRRQATDGRSHPRRQRTQRPRRDAQS